MVSLLRRCSGIEVEMLAVFGYKVSERKRLSASAREPAHKYVMVCLTGGVCCVRMMHQCITYWAAVLHIRQVCTPVL